MQKVFHASVQQKIVEYNKVGPIMIYKTTHNNTQSF